LTWLCVYKELEGVQFVLEESTAAFCLLENQYRQMLKLLLKLVDKQSNSRKKRLIVTIKRGCHQHHTILHKAMVTLYPFLTLAYTVDLSADHAVPTVWSHCTRPVYRYDTSF
jgi:hypothetical protein